ncbi:helix-turn-helix transcriptional regulator [Algicola sagamiensis]|uniref:helix-turn-helix transcriptional regulator n=1 Tax=Algicola sagamiensis TaxID=163869 RepID=UPI0003A10833|nr:metalloregulator ArsR/SmtB family transcription factor [Algicola sagamiensis]
MMKGASVDRILHILKTQGPQTAQQIAKQLSMTSMGARQHLQALEQDGMISTFDRAEKRGRPSRFWQLTQQGHARFPDRHSDLSIQLIQNIKATFGESGLSQVIQNREKQQLSQYQAALENCQSIDEKVQCLAKMRADEGYMAEVLSDESGLLLVEHHCPICDAATACQNFCRSELSVFQACLPEANVSRVDHIINEDHRCSYRITKK